MLIGRAEQVVFPELGDRHVHARIDSGARTSAIWGSAAVGDDNLLHVRFFGDNDECVFEEYGRQVVATSMGHTDARFTIKTPVRIKGRRIRATFTIADRSSQVYPVLIGRNVLRGKFIVDVELGKSLKDKEKKRIDQLQDMLEDEGSVT